MWRGTAPRSRRRSSGADDVWTYLPAPPPKDRAEYDALLDSMVQNDRHLPATR